MTGALSGIRVIDFGQYLAGPLAALLLADQGAEIVRVDPPGGPRWRHPANAVLQRGKRSIVLDLKSRGDLAVARGLVASADVVIENFRPGVMERLGLGPLATTERHPRLIFCSLPGFAADDPRAALAGWEGVVSAAAGLYYPRLPAASADPIYSAVPLASSYAAFIAAHSIVAALIARQRGGFGQHIEVALFDAAFQVMGREAQIVDGVPAVRERLPINRAVIKRHRCADGSWVDISPPLRGFAWFAERYLPKSAIETGIADIFNAAASEELAALLARLFETRSAAHWERAVNEETGAPMALCQTSAEWLADEHARASRCVIPLADPELGPTWQAGYPIALSITPPQAPGPRHALDADRAAILAELPTAPRSPSPDAPPAMPARPLDGFLVLDLSQILAGPTACRVLAEYGAEVIKINNPRPENPLATTGHTFVNNGKRTLLLDLKAPQGRELLWRLVERADVLHQNFVRGLPERLGLDEAAVRRHRPEIVYSSVNTHADGGFRARWRGHEELGQAVTGMQTRLGGTGEPARAGWPACDYGTGHLSAFGILLALYHRLRSGGGEGQHVEASLSGTGTFLQIPFMVDFAGRCWDEPNGLDAKGSGPLYRLYEGSDRWFFLAARQPGELARLAAIEGLDGAERVPEGELPALLAERFAAAPAALWVARLTAAGLGAQIARDVHENMADPVHIARGLVLLRDHPELGRIANVGRSRRFSRTPPDPLFAAPPPGWDSRAIVEATGWGATFGRLVADGVVARRLPAGTPVRAPTTNRKGAAE